MDNDMEWIQSQLAQLFEQSTDYKQKALLLGLKEMIEEQSVRKEQIQGELDGTLWSAQNWES